LQDIAKLLHAFRTLHERLEGVYDIREVDCVLYLQPFLEVITSESTRSDWKICDQTMCGVDSDTLALRPM